MTAECKRLLQPSSKPPHPQKKKTPCDVERVVSAVCPKIKHQFHFWMIDVQMISPTSVATVDHSFVVVGSAFFVFQPSLYCVEGDGMSTALVASFAGEGLLLWD